MLKTKNKQKHIKKTLVALIILGLLFLHFYVPRFITEIKNPIISAIKQNNYEAKVFFDTNTSEGEYLIFNSFDGTELSCYITYSNADSIKGTIILLHGIRSTKEHFIALSKKLSKLGYNSVALDSRAHGQSKGTHCTFGVKEKKDISALIDILLQQEKINKNIGIWGQSLGGAIGLQALGNDSRIKFGIIESTFSDFRTITNDYFNYHAGFNIKSLTNYLIDRAGTIADFNPEDAKPIKYCEKINQPILLVHGNEDKRININYALENFSKIPSKQKEFVEIKNAHHLNVWEIGGNAYFDKVLTFLELNTKKH